MKTKIAALSVMTCLLSACNSFYDDSLTEPVVNPVPKKTLSQDRNTETTPSKKVSNTSSDSGSQLVPAPVQQNNGQAVVPNVAPALGE